MIYKQRKRNNNSNISVSNDFNISNTFKEILINRGYDTDLKINEFLNPNLSFLLDPFLFNNMGYLINKIEEYVSFKKKIIIYGDYDVDGTMATSSLFLALLNKGAIVDYYIPDRHKDGYGLNKNALQYIKNNMNGDLIITVDCGITSVEEVEFCKQLGMEIIITDHHEPKEILPNCAIIDAKVKGENYPFKDLCGTGVVAKIIHALCGINVMKKFLDLIAMATVADLVPLIGENRIFVSEGLKFMNYIKRPGVKELFNYIGEGPIESYHLGFRIGPMINACGRLGNATDVVKLMTTNDINIISPLAKKLYDYNEERKVIEKNIYEECLNMLGNDKRKSIVLWSDHWESGVVGIVASRLIEIYHCPAILLCFDKDNNIYSGSGRSIDGIDIFNTLKNCSMFLKSFGGHKAAAGMKITIENLDNFSKKFNEECSKYDDEIFDETLAYDEVVKLSSFNKSFYNEIKLMQPCGLGNSNIKVLLNNVSMKNMITRGKSQQHFSCNVFDDTSNCDAICFNKKIPEYHDDIDIIASLSLSEYKGKEKVSCNIESFKQSDISLQNKLTSVQTQYGIRVVDQPLEVLGLNDKKLKQFHKSGIFTIQELINYFPRKYLDFRYPKMTYEITEQYEVCSIIGTVIKIKQGPKIAYAMVKDDNGGVFMAAWFHQDYVLRLLNVGYRYIFCGQARKSETGLVQIYPSYFGSNISKYQAIIPEYKKISDMAAEYLIGAIDKALAMLANTDFLDKFIVDKFNLLSDYDATMKLHHPSNDFDIRDGQRRKIFNDLFKFNFILKSQAKENVSSKYILKNNDKCDELRKLLPYNLTNDQNNCLNQIYDYVSSGKILNSLVQGDVGSGKTMIALFSMLLAVNNGFQACLIAPTEVLARQHFDEISGYMEQLGYTVGYLVGGLKVRERRATLNGIKDGTINIVVGTHAIIQDSVEFNNLSLVVIDEQHRFGVSQREKLYSLEGPHMISMSATPIPRTLSMAIYGDNIQVYNIKEKPAGRKDIITLRMDNDNDINQFMLEQIRQGRQCYVVCPLIEKSESEKMTDVHSVKKEVDSLVEYFKNYPEVKISNTTGKMKKELISEEIDKFTRNETNILVSTTIIEVGVNIPNSTVMVIKSSERFGLAQAHQLRGRVGRGSHQSYCILQTDKDDPKAEILCNSNDGFEIAKQDLLLRGAGDYIGTQQTGNNKNVMLMMSEPELYKQISELNDEIYGNSPLLAKYKYISDESELF